MRPVLLSLSDPSILDLNNVIVKGCLANTRGTRSYVVVKLEPRSTWNESCARRNRCKSERRRASEGNVGSPTNEGAARAVLSIGILQTVILVLFRIPIKAKPTEKSQKVDWRSSSKTSHQRGDQHNHMNGYNKTKS